MMINFEELISKLQAVHKAVQSASSKQLLEECIGALKQWQLDEQARMVGQKEFYVTQRVKFDELACAEAGAPLSEDGRQMRFFVNTINNKTKQVYVVDEEGEHRPQWIPIQLLIPAED